LHLAAAEGVLEHLLVLKLLLALDGEERVFADLCCCVARSVGVLDCGELPALGVVTG